ncbi:MAG: hypothetical protein RL088_590 [Verrucomicrobiota bacterium]
MKNTAISPAASTIEALESRISPAVLVTGGNLLGGAGNAASGEYSIGENAFGYVKVLSGQAIVWFDGVVIRGISVGPNASIEVTGDVYGDIVANLDASGRLTDSDGNPLNGLDGGVLLPNSIAGIKLKRIDDVDKGSVRNIVTGGSISGLNIAGEVEGIYAGDGVFHADSDAGSAGSFAFDIGFDVNPIVPGMQDGFTLTKSNALMNAGAGVSNSSVGEGRELQVIAGSGNPNNAVFLNAAGPAGGSISGFTVVKASTISSTSSSPSYELIAGDGATGKSGGAGGSIIKFIEKSASGTAVVRAGNGGIGTAGAGGAGGSVKLADFGSLSGAYTIIAGNGGAGTPGGAGGGVSSANFANVLPASSLIAAGDLDGDGTDELVMVDSSSGDFVVGYSNDDGATFTLLRQYTNASLDPVFIVDGDGIASDLDIADMDGDSDLDVVVTYSDTGSITAYLNNGDGTFYSLADDAFKTAAYSFADQDGYFAKYTEVVGNHFIVAAALGAKTRLASVPFGENAPAEEIIATIASPATALTSNPQGDSFVGFGDGTLLGITSSGAQSIPPPALGGAIVSLAIGEGGNALAVLSKDKKVSTFTLSTGATMTPNTAIDASSSSGTLLQVGFIDDGDNATPDRLLLSRLSGVTSFDVYQRAAGAASYSLATTVDAPTAFKQFDIVVTSDGSFGIAGITGSANSFGFSKDLGTFDVYSLPFNGKQVTIGTGRGGDGLSLGTKPGSGGAGGGFSGLNIDAVNVMLVGGDGGNSSGGAAGAGGGFVNPASFATAGGSAVSPTIHALESLQLTGGNGGNAGGTPGKSASGGAGGGFTGLVLDLESDNLVLTGGNGGIGNGGAGGAGGGFTNIKATGRGAGIQATGGTGGDTSGADAKAGAGGGFTNFSYTLQNDTATESIEQSYVVKLTGGDGGQSPAGAAGAGGALFTITLKLDGADRTYNGVDADGAPLTDSNLDSTVAVMITGGNGGSGKTGGKGGDITGTKLSTIHDQFTAEGRLLLHYIVANLSAGSGGAGSTGDGGAGGSVNASTFTGVTFYDKDSALAGENPLVIQAGAGGIGGARGGAGGGVSTLVAQNAPTVGDRPLQRSHLASASVIAGNGGSGGNSDGGAGGTIAKLTIGADAFIYAVAGDGGSGGVIGGTTAKGGAGGAVTASTLALINTPIGFAGLIATGGNGGSGRALGGAGGALSALSVNLPLAPLGLGAVLTAGEGGSASGTGAVGGKGGDVTGITNTKDVYSAISLIEAGNGGNAPAGKGGTGGNVSAVRVTGFIGRVLNNAAPLGAFDALGVAGAFGATVHTELVAGLGTAQGIFSGRAGSGTTAGIAGSVKTVQAEAIAAIGSAVNSSGLFGLAELVSAVKASFIGYDVDGDNAFDSGNPGTLAPVDGFILAKALSLVTGSRTGFVFNTI